MKPPFHTSGGENQPQVPKGSIQPSIISICEPVVFIYRPACPLFPSMSLPKLHIFLPYPLGVGRSKGLKEREQVDENLKSTPLPHTFPAKSSTITSPVYLLQLKTLRKA
jgi:hypothetical protein